jgi:hypothetical protein
MSFFFGEVQGETHFQNDAKFEMILRHHDVRNEKNLRTRDKV